MSDKYAKEKTKINELFAEHGGDPKKVFEAFDNDPQDGGINLSELREFLARIVGNARAFVAHGLVMKRLDKDKSGKLEWPELAEILARVSNGTVSDGTNEPK